jgi:hypothetical protein
MEASSSAPKLRLLIEKAIDDHVVTQAEYNAIIHQATDDAIIDPQEQALLSQLREMIEDKSVKLVP